MFSVLTTLNMKTNKCSSISMCFAISVNMTTVEQVITVAI